MIFYFSCSKYKGLIDSYFDDNLNGEEYLLGPVQLHINASAKLSEILVCNLKEKNLLKLLGLSDALHGKDIVGPILEEFPLEQCDFSNPLQEFFDDFLLLDEKNVFPEGYLNSYDNVSDRLLSNLSVIIDENSCSNQYENLDATKKEISEILKKVPKNDLENLKINFSDYYAAVNETNSSMANILNFCDIMFDYVALGIDDIIANVTGGLTCDVISVFYVPLVNAFCDKFVFATSFWILSCYLFLSSAPIAAILVTVRSNIQKLNKVENENASDEYETESLQEENSDNLEEEEEEEASAYYSTEQTSEI
jgi:hypothetical protein